MKCPTCGSETNEVNAAYVKAVLDIYGVEHWSTYTHPGDARDGLELVASKLDYDDDVEYNEIYMVFKVISDGSYWRLGGSCNSYGTEHWDDEVTRAVERVKTITVWE